MGITINTGGKKNKATPKVENQLEIQEAELSVEERLVAAIGAKTLEKAATLFTQIDELKADVKALESDYKVEVEKIRDALEAEDLPPSKKLVLKTESGFRLEIAAEKKATVILDKEKLYHALEEVQEGLFFELSKIGLTDAKNHIPVAGNPEIFKTETTGVDSRALKFKS